MSGRRCWIGLLATVMLALTPAQAADAPLDLPAAGGLVDPGQLLPAEQAKKLTAACEQLSRERSAKLLVVVEPKAGSPRTADTLLKQWAGAARDAQAAVLQITFETRAADLALSPSLTESLPDAVRTQLLDQRVKPALSPHVNNARLAVAEALVFLAAQLQAALPEPRALAVKVTRLPPPPAPPLWRHPGWWVGLPTLLFLLILGARAGGRTALAYLVPLLMLYGGLYLTLRFEPLLLVISAPMALVPVWIARAEPVVSRAIRGVVVRCGGFGCSLRPQRRGGF
ncbi:MAG: TPM domain-containing protein [Armatimonadetes bacterium]|nr:TPM domain-containing protein [Armatimonadota bacterium]